ncbi:MAG TPA: hypothetical protein VGX78_10950 [Pirellulales bacterium]|jgi:hypothetical protein|nr:hypothetical protein [Pirellulales bacterium]
MNNPRKLVQFLGGPLDGHRQDISQRKEPLPVLLHLEISANTYRTLEKQPVATDAAATSLAVYELKAVKGVDTYCFVTAKKPQQNRTAER